MSSYTPLPDQAGDIPQKLQDIIAENKGAWNALATVRATWNDKERLLIGRLADQYSLKTARSHVTDAHLSTLAWERQSRVCSQLPSGTIFSTSKKDDTAAALMNTAFFKYVIPNANSQFDPLTKLRMTGVYASVYGAQFILYDYRIDDEYIGPDFWLIPARNVMPQPGRNSISDCAWVDVSTVVNGSYFTGILKRKTSSWNKAGLRKLKALIKDGAVPSRDVDSTRKSAVENVRAQGSSPVNGQTPRVELVTRYERGKDGHWITWAPDYPEVGILRDIPNPHQSGRIPIVARYCFPLLDSIFGLGDFERGITLQKAKDSLINLYLEAVKMSIFPPLKIDVASVTASTIKWQAGTKWLMKDLNAVQAMETSPMGIQTFQGTAEWLSTSLLNQFGTTDTASNSQAAANPAFGRTPEALQMQQERESARDSWDRYMLEKCVQELYEGMINLLGEKQEKPINFHIFDEDIAAIKEQFEDEESANKVMTTVDKRTAKLTISKKDIGGQYRFFVDPSSSLKNNEDAQVESLQKIMGVYMQNPQAIDQLLAAENMKFSFAQAFKQIVYNSGINDPDDILQDSGDDGDADQNGTGQPSQAAQQQMQQMQQQQPAQFQDPQIAAVAQQMFGHQPQGGPR